MNARTKLKESGLSVEDARTLGIDELADVTHLQEHYRSGPALYIPYFDLRGKPVPDMHRVRYLGDTSSGFERGRKYDQPKGVPPFAYFPRAIQWAKIASDPRLPIFITEGELKAACGWKFGLSVIGLGGVWSWRTKNLGLSLLPALAEVDWTKRATQLVFDSDVAFNADVRIAIQHLGKELAGRGAQVRLIRLPQEEGKVGLDDFLVKHGLKAFNELERLPLFEDQMERDELFSSWIYIAQEDHVVDLRFEPPVAYRSRQHMRNATQHETVADTDGNMIPASEAWFKDPGRIIVPCYTMDPTNPERVIPGVGYNQYRGLGVEPKRGDCSPILKLIDMTVGKRKELKKAYLQWLAAPLQNPGMKISWCLFVFHYLQGHGKTFVAQIMLEIYGYHGINMDEKDFFGDWNEWVEKGLFCLCDDLSFDGSKKSRHTLKSKITEEQSQLYKKYRDTQEVRNYANFYFTANTAGALPLEVGTNRRVCVINMQQVPEKKWLLGELNTWRENGGAAHFLYYLLHNVDCSDFNRWDDAPWTEEKQLAIDSSASSLELWMQDALSRHLSDSPLWTHKQISHQYAADTNDSRSGSAAITRALQAIGCVQYPGKVELNGVQESVWILPSHPELAKLSSPKLKKKYAEHFPLSLDTPSV